MKPKRVFSQPADVATRLAELGLTEAVLRTAIETAMGHVLSCTKYDPPSLKGMLGWGKGVRSLREQLCPLGWLDKHTRNFETVEHPDGLCALTVAAGDALTGIEDELRQPSTRSPKGPVAQDAIHVNKAQAEIADFVEGFPRVQRESNTRTWFLLYCADQQAEEIRIELSLPFGMAEDGHVDQWTERIIVGPAPFPNAPKTTIDDDNDGDDDGSIDVLVERIG